MILAILGSLFNAHFLFIFSLRIIVLAIAFSFSIFLICGKVCSCSAGENYIVMAKRKRFSTDEILSSLRNIRDDVSECEDGESESVTIGGKKFWVFNSKFIPSLIIVPEVIAHPVCAYRIMFIRIDGI